MTTKNNNIPYFGLYGESNWIQDSEFFHIEDIASRSSHLDWKINAHRHTHLLQLLILRSGEARVRLDEKQQKLPGCWSIIVPAGVVHSFRFSPDTDGCVITIADSLLEDVYSEKAARHITPLLSQADCISFNGHQSVFAELWSLVALLEREFSLSQDGRALMSEYLIKAILLLLNRQKTRDTHTEADTKTDGAKAQMLKELIEKHYKEHWSNEEYANTLGISISRLNRLCKAAFDQTIRHLVEDRLLLEAKRSLIYTARSVEEVGYDLGFKDPGYFSRFFKRSTGMPPGKFRALSNQPILS